MYTAKAGREPIDLWRRRKDSWTRMIRRMRCPGPANVCALQGQQFSCSVFKDWCDRQGITPRFGAVGQHGSIALIERFILSLKNGCARIILVPLRTDAIHQ